MRPGFHNVRPKGTQETSRAVQQRDGRRPFSSADRRRNGNKRQSSASSRVRAGLSQRASAEPRPDPPAPIRAARPGLGRRPDGRAPLRLGIRLHHSLRVEKRSRRKILVRGGPLIGSQLPEIGISAHQTPQRLVRRAVAAIQFVGGAYACELRQFVKLIQPLIDLPRPHRRRRIFGRGQWIDAGLANRFDPGSTRKFFR